MIIFFSSSFSSTHIECHLSKSNSKLAGEAIINDLLAPSHLQTVCPYVQQYRSPPVAPDGIEMYAKLKDSIRAKFNEL